MVTSPQESSSAPSPLGGRIGVFHPGTQHSWQTALAYQEAGRLGWYATSVFYDPARWPYRVERYLPERLSQKLNREFRRRWFARLDPALVRTFGFYEWIETAALRARMRGLAARFNLRGNQSFAGGVISLLQSDPVDAVWGYNSSSLEVFRWAKARGICCVLDQTIGHPRAHNAVMQSEYALHPEFFFDDVPPYDAYWLERQDEEVALADLVVVGCEFAAQTMIDNGCPREKLRIIPYGYDETSFSAARPLRDHGGPARFLFVGTLDARKGVPYLFKAFERIPASVASLVVVGDMAMPQAALDKYAARFTYAGQLPRHEIAAQFAQADCFVFPSLFEGGGIVLYEAVGSGVGVIQGTASAIVVDHGRNGVVMDKISVEGLAREIAAAAAAPETLPRWQAASWEMRGNYGWDRYRERLRNLTA